MSHFNDTSFKTKGYQIFLVKFSWLLIIIFFCAVLLGEYFLIIKPKLNQTVGGGALDLAVRREILTKQKTYLENLKKMEKDASQINVAELEKLNYVLAKQIKEPEILNQINSLEARIKEVGREQNKEIEMVDFSFTFGGNLVDINLVLGGGDYYVVKKILDDIEKNNKIMDVKKITVRELGNYLQLNIQSYYLE
jgi:hypothetical protein